MTQSDLDVLLDMGFEKPRAELAVKKSGGLQGALQWLEDNQDKPLEDLQKAAAAATEDDAGENAAEIAALESGEVAKSLVCNECGKKFRSNTAVEFHATKSGHTDFSQSTEEIAPLTEEEKKARLEELRAKLKEKKATQSVQDQLDAKKNEKIRAKSTIESQDLKEELKRKEHLKDAAKARAQKAEDKEAKKRIMAKIAADKEERRIAAEEAKAKREGKFVPTPAPAPAAAAASSSAPARAHNEARLRLQWDNGTAMMTLASDTTLFEVASALESEHGIKVTKFEMNLPRKVFEGDIDFSKTLQEAGLVPSAALRVK